MEELFAGRNMDLDDAKEMGLLNYIFDAESDEKFMEQIFAYAEQFCPPNAASLAVGHIKRAVQSGTEVPLEYGLAIERELQAKLFSSGDAKIGLNAYVEKQKPEFKGS